MPQPQISVESAVNRLREFSKLTQHRMDLKPREARCARAAFQLLATGPPSTDPKRVSQSIRYFEFLQRVQTILGNEGNVGIVLCAAGLGPSAIFNMKDTVRVYLPSKLKEEWASFEIGVLQTLAKNYTKATKQVFGGVDQGSQILPPIEANRSQAKFTPGPEETASLSGDVYELTVEDVQGIATMPDQIAGKIRLTETYNPYTPSFIIIPVSNEFTNRLIIHRPRVI
ncbi:hypothetical protein ACJ73_02049 [Blastomyces percursus]|uniref:Uncharacterized protein n=1 Tax=Blastomyces percursus TaxID=1658174 RepID=A0A1J9RD99_9EURO|nr:hypothetical protein ACJ73_02049 [Blastomyces percursus]